MTHAACFAASLLALSIAVPASRTTTPATAPASPSIQEPASPTQAPAASNEPSARGTALVREAVEAMGGDAWKSIRSYTSMARVRSAMGELEASYSFVAPDAHLLLQRIGGARSMSMEMGFADGIAWTGEQGRPQRMDRAMADEVARGGDVVTLLRSLESRFADFRHDGIEKDGARVLERITMRPKADAAAARWTLFVDPTTKLPAGLDIPAPAGTPDAERASRTQSLRFDGWRAVATADGSASPRLRAPFSFSIVAGGVRSECVFASIAVDTLAAGSIRAPESLRSGR